ncbi:thioredoxin [Penicillium hispanicum]|uniref:thioredoxin n=1 Tax=Penicillium hispanicum TaxID=1080232 RepID=UPI00254141EB|nr:thioredoxin [Penicillium hispanicum]KAJ5584146.1 thioredoxin [Penicillium hispanicum]
MTNFKIQIISDTVCPWCFVGYRRLSRAIAAHQGNHPNDTFDVSWRAFYLNPASPTYPGVNKQEMYSVKFGAARSAAMFSRLSSVGASEGIAFRFGGNTGSTRDSHRLLWYAGQEESKRAGASAPRSAAGSVVVGGLQTRVVENLFRAYFEEEKNITDPAVLIEAAVGAGLDRGEVERLLESDAGGAEVDSEAQTASRRLVTGVPYFSVQGKYSVEGADEPETFLEVFERVKQEA